MEEPGSQPPPHATAPASTGSPRSGGQQQAQQEPAGLNPVQQTNGTRVRLFVQKCCQVTTVVVLHSMCSLCRLCGLFVAARMAQPTKC